MTVHDYIRQVIRVLLEAEDSLSGNRNLEQRGGKGYGAGHPWAQRKSTKLGMSTVEEKLIDDGVEISSLEPAEDTSPVKISKAFKRKIST